LKGLHQQGKLTTVLIKEGVPFVPSFLFAYLVVIFGDDIFSWLVALVFA